VVKVAESEEKTAQIKAEEAPDIQVQPDV